MVELLKSGLVARAHSTRTLARVVKLSDSEKDLAAWLEQSALLWVGRDISGHPVDEQMRTVRTLIQRELA